MSTNVLSILISINILYVILIPFRIKAQDRPQADTLEYDLEPIEVKAVHSSITVDEVPRALIQKNRSLEEINSSSALTLDKLTYDMPGIWVNNRHNYALGQRMTIRGIGWRSAFGIRGIQVILDGIPLTTADGQTVTNLVDPAFIRDMEVLRGPASTFWGNSSGGVVYLSTRPSYTDAPRLRVRGMAGSYGLHKTEAEYIQQWDKNSMHVFGSYFRQDGFREHSEARIGRVGLTSRWHLGENSSLRIFGAYASMPKAENPSTMDKDTARITPRSARNAFVGVNAREEVNHGQLGATLHQQLPVGTLSLTGYGVYRDLVSPLPFSYIDLDRLMGGGRIMFENSIDRLDWNAGIESKYQRDDRMNRNTTDEGEAGADRLLAQLETVSNWSAFGLLNYKLTEDIKASSGIRYDRLNFSVDDHLLRDGDQSGSRSFHAWSPSFGLSYSMGSRRFYANASTAFEAPTTTELVNRPGGGGGFNPSLEPENTVSLETGFKGQFSNPVLSYDLALYTMWIDDLLLPYQTETSDRTFYRNEGETRHSGLELAARLQLSPSLNTKISYTYVRARFRQARTASGTDVDQNRIPGIPALRASATLDWNPGKFMVHLEAQGVSSYPVNSENTFENDGYVVLNSKISYTGFPLADGISLTPFLEIDNTTGTRYNSSVTVNARNDRYYEPAPDRHWTAGFTLEFD